MNGPAVGLVLLALAVQVPAPPDRWLYNPRERTSKAVDAFQDQRFEDSLELAETAHRLAPEDPVARFNAGTARLAAGDREGALSLLEQLAATLTPGEEATEPPPPVPEGLAAATHYNLGNARLAGGDASGAVDAFTQALRLRPEDVDAKHNLELALQQLQEQQQEQQNQQQQPPQDQQDQQDQQEQQEGGPPEEPQPPSEDGEQPPQPDPGEDQQPQIPPRQDSRLEDFENQPDMTAAEAASILEAVEALERQHREEEGAERARQRSPGGKDW